jgi:hypothetical protein
MEQGPEDMAGADKHAQVVVNDELAAQSRVALVVRGTVELAIPSAVGAAGWSNAERRVERSAVQVVKRSAELLVVGYVVRSH